MRADVLRAPPGRLHRSRSGPSFSPRPIFRQESARTSHARPIDLARNQSPQSLEMLSTWKWLPRGPSGFRRAPSPCHVHCGGRNSARTGPRGRRTPCRRPCPGRHRTSAAPAAEGSPVRKTVKVSSYVALGSTDEGGIPFEDYEVVLVVENPVPPGVFDLLIADGLGSWVVREEPVTSRRQVVVNPGQAFR